MNVITPTPSAHAVCEQCDWSGFGPGCNEAAIQHALRFTHHTIVMQLQRYVGVRAVSDGG